MECARVSLSYLVDQGESMGRTWGTTAIMLLLSAANGGCLTWRPDPPDATPATLAVSAPPAVPELSAVALAESEPMLCRAVSSEEPGPAADSSPERQDLALPGGLQTYPLNPLFDVLSSGTAQNRQDALQTLGLMGVSGLAQMMHAMGGGCGGHHGFHQMADLTNDLLQPDDDSQQDKRIRPPFAFGLEWKY
jgi:hypothetical protein